MTPEQLAEMKRPVAHGPQALWTLREQKQALLAEVQLLQKRLKVAEDICVAFGWTAVNDDERSKAVACLWHRWAAGRDDLGPEAHPDLDVADLARQYDEFRAENFAKLRLPDGGESGE